MKPRSAKARPELNKSLVGFFVAGTRYAVSVNVVRQVINPMVVTPIPQAPAYVLGLAEFRGEVIPVVDFRLLLGAPAELTRRTKWIVLDMAGRAVAIVVDAATGVFGSTTDVRAAPLSGGGDAVRCIVGVASHDGSMVYVVDVARLGLPLAPLLERASLPA
jgi:purine-binding chemotaxis protein CheW